MPVRLHTTLPLLALLAWSIGCTEFRAGDAETESITDAPYLAAPLWNDGRAEVAFYRVHRARNQYGQPDDQTFLVGTYLVKHDFDPDAEAKAAPDAARKVAAFKYALFYEFESGSYEYKRSHVVNARQSDLTPLKASFTSFDWCSNLYEEQSFALDGEVSFLARSDDYGNRRGSFAYRERTYPPALVPLLVRGMDFEGSPRLDFGVVLESGEVVGAAAELAAVDTVTTAAGRRPAERIVITYDRPVPSTFAEETDSTETYWRGMDEARLLVAVEGATGRYRMELVEALRSAYWEEDVYERLERVRVRP